MKSKIEQTVSSLFLAFSCRLRYILLFFIAHPAVTHRHTHTHGHPPQNSEKQRNLSSNLWDFLCWLMVERFRHATQDEANKWNVKIMCNSKNKTTQVLPFEEIISTRSGVEQIKQAVLYTQQQPEWSCQMSFAENRTEWILQMFIYLIM